MPGYGRSVILLTWDYKIKRLDSLGFLLGTTSKFSILMGLGYNVDDKLLWFGRLPSANKAAHLLELLPYQQELRLLKLANWKRRP